MSPRNLGFHLQRRNDDDDAIFATTPSVAAAIFIARPSMWLMTRGKERSTFKEKISSSLKGSPLKSSPEYRRPNGGLQWFFEFFGLGILRQEVFFLPRQRVWHSCRYICTKSSTYEKLILILTNKNSATGFILPQRKRIWHPIPSHSFVQFYIQVSGMIFNRLIEIFHPLGLLSIQV